MADEMGILVIWIPLKFCVMFQNWLLQTIKKKKRKLDCLCKRPAVGWERRVKSVDTNGEQNVTGHEEDFHGLILFLKKMSLNL